MAARDTKRLGVEAVISQIKAPVAANAVVEAGTLGAFNAAGFLVPASASATLKVAGRIGANADNTGGANGEVVVGLERGTFGWDNSAGLDEITQADVLNDVFAVDEFTVAKTDGGGTRPVAGKLVQLEGSQAYVETY